MKRLNNLLSHKKVEVKDIPDIDLYMDQLTGYIDKELENFKVDEDEKILTKTMINNYVKAKVIDKPVKKKYNKNHIMELIMIYHLKNILSIAEVDSLFKIQNKASESESTEKNLHSTEDIYNIFLEVQKEVVEEAKINLEKEMGLVNNSSKDTSIRNVLKLALKADINKRLAELTLKELME